MAVITRSELRLVCRDFYSLVDAGLLQDTLHDAEHFVRGYLACEAEYGEPSPDRLRLIVLPGFGKGKA
jgi:hypothetical protein